MSDNNVKIIPITDNYRKNYSRIFDGKKSTKLRRIVQYRYTYKFPIHEWIESTNWTSKSFEKCCIPVGSILIAKESREIEYNE